MPSTGTTLGQAQELQQSIMGYLPGFATPRLMCEPPMLGNRQVYQEKSYDRVRGISYWTKNYRTSMEIDDAEALTREYRFYDPVDLLPEEGKEYWRQYRRRDQATPGSTAGELAAAVPGRG